ncbi:nicotinate-nucleotide--dimethylbenzimidazole phosphoribosyltransferase [Colwellia sp. MB3u-28]|nr:MULTISPECIES: nicotinate-nucleotide--dimethylbenzimidazole phosphoribosyltransferase [unclassified Colwellia]MBA6255482.1 nicotinate-nucleotide--dimethylbenzimidazole phosphoribosyltransferase [Colwellia sp. MB3u-28]MBA6261622.1 nicotinate-nucleotide--dimethylbenzimidazole phosphoribosyltransferase [Colwellia sp. MB3u-41]MBA6305343.1 nicotinate-nucleotide--dimethylbenzimidazole phosphoribosyltransferase [Colwellia sp. MB02u-14]
MSFAIKKITNEFDEHIQTTLDGKTKPLGALGQLENTAKIIARVQYSSLNSVSSSLKLNKPSLLIFAGDHGVAAEGVSIAPSDVTSQMVANFATGGAAINVFCKQLGWQLSVVDTGILSPPESYLGVIDQRLGTITEPLNVSPAMSEAQVELGFEKATTLIKKMHKSGCNLIAFGEMGIGNTTSASAIMSAVMNITAQESVGRGTGVSDEVIKRKQQVIEQALTLHKDELNNAKDILRCLGGFEIVQITAAMLAAAEQKMLVVVDGFICTAAAMLAIALNKNVKDYMIFAHCSGEQGHQSMLDYLQVKPLLNLGLRLGEGTGAALALPLIQASAAFYNDMASFAQAEVTDVTDIKTSGVEH